MHAQQRRRYKVDWPTQQLHRNVFKTCTTHDENKRHRQPLTKTRDLEAAVIIVIVAVDVTVVAVVGIVVAVVGVDVAKTMQHQHHQQQNLRFVSSLLFSDSPDASGNNRTMAAFVDACIESLCYLGMPRMLRN